MGRIKCIVTRDKTAQNHFLNFARNSIIVIDSHVYSLMAYSLSCPLKNMDNLLAYCYSSKFIHNLVSQLQRPTNCQTIGYEGCIIKIMLLIISCKSDVALITIYHICCEENCKFFSCNYSQIYQLFLSYQVILAAFD